MSTPTDPSNPSSPARASLDRAQVHHVAKLAALSLTDEEATTLADQLAAIVRHVDELNQVDVSTVSIDSAESILESNGARSWREDIVLQGLSHEDALAQAPRKEHGGFAVPTFVEN